MSSPCFTGFSGGERLICRITGPRRFSLPNRATRFGIIFWNRRRRVRLSEMAVEREIRHGQIFGIWDAGLMQRGGLQSLAGFLISHAGDRQRASFIVG